MEKKFYLPGLYSKSEEKLDSELQQAISIINEKETPLLYQFIHNPTNFYKENFRDLEQCKIREKRLLEFETPNRAKITHEYDIVLTENFDFKTYHFLFNPINRLNWLKIRQEGKRILIASKVEVKKMIEEKLDSELKQSNNIDFFNNVWENQKRYPCFVKVETTERRDFLLEAEFFDSVKEVDDAHGTLFSPFEERSISYKYESLKGYSSWLYVRAPKDFKISIPKDSLKYESTNQIDFHTENGSDPDINTLTIINKHEGENPTVEMDIKITIPSSRKVWFLTIYWTAMLMMVLLLNNVYIKFCEPLFITNIALESIDLRIIIALIAGIITTRGWLITEETILRRYSKHLTVMLILLILLSIISTM